MVLFENQRAPFDKLRVVGRWNWKRRTVPFAARHGQKYAGLRADVAEW